MSVQAGQLYFDRRPIEAPVVDAVERMLTRVLAAPVRSHTEPGLIMASQWIPGDRDVLSDGQPLVSAHGYALTWDGRLDNRQDLILRLAKEFAGKGSPTDAAVALAAYLRWGPDAFGMLVGDWSLALWDADERAVYLASDYMGIRPLHFHHDSTSCAWSTLLRPLAVHRGCDRDVPTEYVARFLVSDIPPRLTPYAGVQAVPASHYVRIRDSGSSVVRLHWRPCQRTIRCGRGSDHEEALRVVFCDAVRSRLGTGGHVWAELSGGIDSSSIVCAASALISFGFVEATGVRLVSQVSADTLGGDERAYIRMVEQVLGSRSHYLTSASDSTGLPPEHWAAPTDPAGPRAAGLLEVARQEGHLLLSGRVGDTVMWNDHEHPEALFEYLAPGTIGQLWNAAHQWCLAVERPLVVLVASLARQYFRSRHTENTGAARRVASLKGSTLLRDELLTPDILATDTHWLDERTQGSVAKRRLLDGLARYSSSRLLHSPSDLPHVRYSYPYAHRPLVDLVLGLPAVAQWQPNEPRALMRRAFADFVPPAILGRRSKGYYAPVLLRSLRLLAAEWSSRINHLEIVRRGWIDPKKLSAALTTLQGAKPREYQGVQLAARLEAWLTAGVNRSDGLSERAGEASVRAAGDNGTANWSTRGVSVGINR